MLCRCFDCTAGKRQIEIDEFVPVAETAPPPAPRKQKAESTAAPLPRAGEIAAPLPQNIDAERNVLGAILLDNSALQKVHLRPEDFFHSHHRHIFFQMLEMAERHQPIELVTITDDLRRAGDLEVAGGAAYISQLMDGVPHVSNVEYYGKIVRDYSARRHLIHAAEAAKEAAFNGREDVASIVEWASTSFATIATEIQSGSESWQKRFHMVDELPDDEPIMLVDGAIPEGVVFIGGSSGVGKTWLALAIARALTQGGRLLGVYPVPQILPVLYLVPEMNARSFRKRCQRYRIKGELFRCMTISDGAPLDLGDPLLLAAIRALRPVVFLDTAIRFSSADSENSSSDNAQGLAKAIFALLHTGARAAICLHHRSKDAARSEEMTLENTTAVRLKQGEPATSDGPTVS